VWVSSFTHATIAVLGVDWSRFVVERRLVMETDTARAVVKAIYPTIIVITVMLLAASWGMGLL